MNLEKYQELKHKVDKLRREADRAEGALGQLMDRLRDEFDCDSLEAARKKLKKLEREAASAEREYGEKLSAFKEKWESVLEARVPNKAFDDLIADQKRKAAKRIEALSEEEV